MTNEPKKHIWPRYDQSGRTSPGDKAASALLEDRPLYRIAMDGNPNNNNNSGMTRSLRGEIDDYTGLHGIKEITSEMEAADRAAINKWLVSCITSAPADSGLHTMTALEIKAIALNFLINTRKDVVVGPTEENSLSRWY